MSNPSTQVSDSHIYQLPDIPLLKAKFGQSQIV